VLTRAQLDRAVFPLGDSTKQRVRQEAAERGLAVADKPDSHDICFIADGDTKGFLAERLGAAPGDIVDGRTGAVGQLVETELGGRGHGGCRTPRRRSTYMRMRLSLI